MGFALFERAKSGVHLTAGGQSLMGHVNRTLAEFDAVVRAAGETGSGNIGAIRLGVRLPPVGEPLVSLLAGSPKGTLGQSVDWADLRDEDLLIQEWDESQATRELYASLLGQSSGSQRTPRASRAFSRSSPRDSA